MMLVFALTLIPLTLRGDVAPRHLSDANRLVDSLRTATKNDYGPGKPYIVWTSDKAAAHTRCSSMVTLLVQHAYRTDASEMKRWLGSTDPKADDYYDAIVANNGFKRIEKIQDVKAGDFIAIKFTDHHKSGNGAVDTGHIMVFAEAPVRIENHKPSVVGTDQYLCTIIDSSYTGHGPKDTRAHADGKFSGGIGRGQFRLYADLDGDLKGYSWSDADDSQYFTGPNRIFAVGRLTRTFAPASPSKSRRTPSKERRRPSR